MKSTVYISNIWHELSSDVAKLICQYVGNDRIKPWVKALESIDYYWLSENPSAMHLLEANQDKIDWYQLSANPSALALLEANPNKIDWYKLSVNPSAIHLLEANQDKINKNMIWCNPTIFEPYADHFALLMQVRF